MISSSLVAYAKVNKKSHKFKEAPFFALTVLNLHFPILNLNKRPSIKLNDRTVIIIGLSQLFEEHHM